MRDLAVKGDDLIVATHGRGFWIIDNITPLRQISDEVTQAAAHLFRPATAIIWTPGSDNGTPQPRDEALADNPPNGAVIDYYLKTAGGPVVLEIIDPSGETIRRYANDDKVTPVNPETLNIPAFWRPAPKTLSAAAGLHRWVWDFRPTPPVNPPGPGGGGGGFGGRATTVLPGKYTVKLSVDGKSYTQTLVVQPDPRLN